MSHLAHQLDLFERETEQPNPHARVFVPNRRDHHNMNRLRDFGRPVIITDGKLDIVNLNKLRVAVEQALDDFNPNIDFIVASGSIIANLVLGMVVSYTVDHSVRVLVWDARQHKYISTRVDLPPEE